MRELNNSCQAFSTVGFLGGSVIKNPQDDAGDTGSISGSGRAPGVGNGNPLCILAWEIPWTEKPSGLPSLGLQRVGYD